MPSPAAYGAFDYSPANGGVPAAILRCLDDWYRLPKFTAGELRAHGKKIAKACGHLLDLLGQVAPDAPYPSELSALPRVSPDQARTCIALVDSLNLHKARVPTRLGSDLHEYEKVNFANRAISEMGFTSIEAIRHVGARALLLGSAAERRVVTKVRAKEVIKHWFIFYVSRAPHLFTPGPQLVADVVAVLTDTDCSADDVRKARKQHTAEDRRVTAVWSQAEDSAVSNPRNVPLKNKRKA